MNSFGRANLDKYNTLVMVSGSYTELDSVQRQKLKTWVSKGNTIVAIAGGSKWMIDKKMVNESLTKKPKSKEKEATKRLPYVDAGEYAGRDRVGGIILEVDLDVTHPLGFGYRSAKMPVYKNNMVFLAPSKNPYVTVAKYSESPHIDGYITKKNLDTYIKPSASLIVSTIGRGRAVLFADNPNFRGAWYGTNKLFLNALFFGNKF